MATVLLRASAHLASRRPGTWRLGLEVVESRRRLAVAAQAMVDAAIAAYDAKHHYGFWRPITAIRNGETDGEERAAPCERLSDRRSPGSDAEARWS